MKNMAHTCYSFLNGRHLGVYGGCDGLQLLDTLYLYNIEQNMWTEPKIEGDEKPEGRMAACMVGGVVMPEVPEVPEMVAKVEVAAKKEEEVAAKEDEVVKKMDSAAKGNGSDDKESSPALVTSAASPGGSGEDAGAGAPPPSSLAEVLYIFGGSTMQVDSNDCYEIVVRNFSLLCPIVFILLTDL